MKKVKKSTAPAAKVTSSVKSGGAPSLDMKNVESQMEGFFTKSFPALPENVVEVLVKISPWLAILSVVFGIPTVLALMGMSETAAFYRVAGMRLGWGYQIGNILVLVQIALSAMAIQGLFARKLSAWRLMYYSSWVSVLSGLMLGNIVSMLIGGLISFYLLFQVKKAYK